MLNRQKQQRINKLIEQMGMISNELKAIEKGRLEFGETRLQRERKRALRKQIRAIYFEYRKLKLRGETDEFLDLLL